jgi:hypothetical protein
MLDGLLCGPQRAADFSVRAVRSAVSRATINRLTASR